MWMVVGGLARRDGMAACIDPGLDEGAAENPVGEVAGAQTCGSDRAGNGAPRPW